MNKYATFDCSTEFHSDYDLLEVITYLTNLDLKTQRALRRALDVSIRRKEQPTFSQRITEF